MPVRGHQIERRAIQAVASDGRLQVWQNVYGKVGGRVVRRSNVQQFIVELHADKKGART